MALPEFDSTPHGRKNAPVTTTDSTEPSAIRHVVHIRLDPALDPDVRLSQENDLRQLADEHPHALRASLHRDLDRRPNASVSAT
jgi:hypothetical protein